MGIDINKGKSDEQTALLKECIKAFNQLPNKKLKNNKYPDTYTLVSEIDKTLK